jgi:acetyl esterase/lipase
MRDAKASVRYLRANAALYNIDTTKITAIGGSAGACSVVGLATTFEDDYKTELSAAEDPTLASTHLQESSAIATGLVQVWTLMLLLLLLLLLLV